MIRLAGALLLCGYLPGAVLFRMPVLARERRARLDAAERAYWAILLSTALTLAAALALAAFGQYSLWRVLAIDAIVTLAPMIVWRSRLGYAAAPRPDAWALVPVALACGAALLYWPPAEYVLGGKDPGVYMNAGIQIAQRGNLITLDATAAGIPARTRDLFFPKFQGQPYYSPRFMGFFLFDPQTGAVVDQFPHLYPAAIAIGYDVRGLTGARTTATVFAVLGVLGVFFLASRLAGRPAGSAAAALLAIHVVQLWYARIPNSEMLGQALLLGAVLATARAHQDEDPFFAPVAGGLLGLTPFARFDAVLPVTLVVGGVLLAWFAGQRLRAWFFAALATCAMLYYAYCTTFLAPYIVRPMEWAAYHQWALALGGAIGVAAVLAAAWLRTYPAARAAVIRWAPRVTVAAVLALAGYGWFLRTPGGSLPIHDANSLRMFGWYVHPAAIAAALLGLILLARRAFWRDPAFFLAVCGTAVFTFQSIRIVPEHFWASRRFVMLILPGVIVAIAAALATPIGSRDAWPPRPGAAVRYVLRAVLLGLVAWSFWQATAAVRPHVEYAGVIARLEALAGRVGSADLLIVESRAASDLHVLALPLAYIYGRHVLVLNTPKPDKLLFAQFLTWARQRYGEVYFLGGGGTDLLSREVAVEPVASERFQIAEYDSPRNAYPTRVRRKEFDFGLYRFVAPAGSAGGVAIDVGRDDDLHVVRFHAKEHDSRGTYRWTRNLSYVSLAEIPADARTVAIWMENGGRPASAPPADVQVFLGDVRLGTARVGRARQEYTFPLPSDAAAAGRDSATLRLVTTTWNPRASLGVDDDRDLGVMVDRVEVRRGP